MEEFVEKLYDENERFQRDPLKPTANTVYLRVNSEQTKGLLGSKYAIPTGYVGLVKDKSGNETVLMPGEEANGEFTAHLVRDAEVRVPFSHMKVQTKDGFEAVANFELSVAPDVTQKESLLTFLEHSVEGRRHLDWPLLKAEIQPHIAKVLKEVLREQDAKELLKSGGFEKIRETVIERTAEHLKQHGIGETSIEFGRIRSSEYEDHLKDAAKQEVKAEKLKAEQKIQSAILRDQMGQELSRQELKEFLSNAREDGLIKEHERKVKDIERQTELDKLEQEYKNKRQGLESALRKVVVEEKLELDSLMLDKHVKVVQQLKDELQEDRIEVYINLLTDEKLKADLLQKLLLQRMSPEQLKAIAEIEGHKSRQAEISISRPKLEPVREENTSEPPRSDTVEVQSENEKTERRELDHENVETVDTAAAAAQAVDEALGKSLSEAIESVELETEPLAEPAESEDEDETIELNDLDMEVVEEDEPESEVDATPEIAALALIAAGRHVYAIDPLSQNKLEDAALNLSYGDARLGSLRSVRLPSDSNDGVLLAGARNGVYATLLSHRKGHREYPIGSGVDARTGINSVVLYRGFIYATHSEFGLLRWPYLQPYSSAVQVMPELISQYSTTRSLQIFDDKLLFANGPSVLLLEAKSETGSTLRVAARYRGKRHEITAITADDQYVLIADTAGEVHVWDPKSDDPPANAFYAGTSVTDLAASELPNGRRCLMVAIKRPIVPMLFRDGTTALEFKAPEPIRSVNVLNGIIIGVSRDRMRLFAWRENHPDWPAWQFQFTDPVLDATLIAPGKLIAPSGIQQPIKTLKKPPGYA
ncbi:MAG: hypothetical protein L3J82_02990 [Planctomycetes bacterium]|nr:hypothetical protein [Planctomycetota bacterium]